MTNICAHTTYVKYTKKPKHTAKVFYDTTIASRRQFDIFTMVKIYFIFFVELCDTYRVNPKWKHSQQIVWQKLKSTCMHSDLHQLRLSARKCGKIFSEKLRNVL